MMPATDAALGRLMRTGVDINFVTIGDRHKVTINGYEPVTYEWSHLSVPELEVVKMLDYLTEMVIDTML